MAVPSSGPVSLSQIRDEFTQGNPIQMSQYYRNGGIVPNAPQNSNIPTSGAISVADFRGATAGLVETITSNSTNLNAATIFGSNWTQDIPKILIIDSGVKVGSTSATTPALLIPTNLVGSLSVINNGEILGASGVYNLRGASNVTGAGGNALQVQSNVTITNNGNIYSGGGAGGLGGTGGGGTKSCLVPCPNCCTDTNPGFCAPYCNGPNITCFSGNCGPRPQTRCDPQGSQCAFVCCAPLFNPTPCPQPGTCNTNGNGGGNGGQGQGYTFNGPNTAGSQPTAPTDGNAGQGGRGGIGGTWGQPGAQGVTGGNGGRSNGTDGLAGRPAGFYIVGNNFVTWANLGSVLGRVAS